VHEKLSFKIVSLNQLKLIFYMLGFKQEKWRSALEKIRTDFKGGCWLASVGAKRAIS